LCETEGLKNVVSASLMRGRKFMKNDGVEITRGPLAGLGVRAVVVRDENDRLLYAQRVPEIKDEPDCQAALSVLG
jgi:thiol peroxidase